MGAKLDEMNGDRNRTDPPAPETPLLTPGRKALLALVIVMGMMIVGGVVTIVVTIIGRIAGPETVKTEGAVLAPPAAISAPAALAPFGDLDLAIGADAQVLDATLQGGMLLVRVSEPGTPGQRLLVFDLETGARLGTVTLKSE